MIQRPLHVTIASTQPTWHGGEHQAALLAKGIRARGHRCTILCRAGGEFEKRMRDEFEVHSFPGSGRSLKGVLEIRQHLLELKPDVLHANDAHALSVAGVAGLGLAIPVRVAARRVDFPLHWAGRYRRFADGVVCVSRAVAAVCEQSGIGRSHLHVVHDGVDPDFATSGSRTDGRNRLGLSHRHRLLLTVAKLTDHKGHQFLVQALPNIVARHRNVVVAFAGDGELLRELQSLARRLRVHTVVRFLGYRTDIADLLAAADVIVQPSHMEGLCSSLIDAMLAAKPIVATTAGGIPDLLQTESDERPVAWLVPPKSPEAVHQAVCTALESPLVARRLGQRACERALERFTADQMVDNTLSVYAQIARRRGVAHAALDPESRPPLLSQSAS